MDNHYLDLAARDRLIRQAEAMRAAYIRDSLAALARRFGRSRAKAAAAPVA
ncbi:MAG: hypothetical protein KGK00_19005 [Paracoccaceae bacterium]|nr:hypothetical protein [Paracoccaceae bacterium]MDE3237391.1 hypothetical protein [Paracoccaceae bacterium]